MTLFALALLAAETAAEEGKKVITAMLIVGLIFVAVIALGETSRWLRHRRGRGHYAASGALDNTHVGRMANGPGGRHLALALSHAILRADERTPDRHRH